MAEAEVSAICYFLLRKYFFVSQMFTKFDGNKQKLIKRP